MVKMQVQKCIFTTRLIFRVKKTKEASRFGEASLSSGHGLLL